MMTTSMEVSSSNALGFRPILNATAVLKTSKLLVLIIINLIEFRLYDCYPHEQHAETDSETLVCVHH